MKPVSKQQGPASTKNSKPPTQFKEFSLSHQKPRKGKRLLDKLLKDNEAVKPVKSTRTVLKPGSKAVTKAATGSKNLLRLKSPVARNSLHLVSPVGKLVSRSDWFNN